MADKKISALTSATTPLAGTEVLPIVQSGSTVKVTINNVTAGKSVPMQQADITAVAGGGFSSPAAKVAAGAADFKLVFLGSSYAGVPANKPWLHSYQDIYVGSDAGTTFNVMSGGLKTLGVDGSGNVTAPSNFVVGTAGKGIDFSANANLPGMTSELLDWYEEGTWVPTDGSGGGLTFTVDHANYTRIGNLVTVNAYITYPVTANTANTNITLPFTALKYDIGTARSSNGAVGCAITVGAASRVTFRNNSLVPLTNANVSGADILFSFTYTV